MGEFTGAFRRLGRGQVCTMRQIENPSSAPQALTPLKSLKSPISPSQLRKSG
jgi:hypothetical protein